MTTNTKLTAQEKLIKLLILHDDPVRFFKASELQEGHGIFIGYEATARISELVQDYPQLVETRKEGRFRTIRFRFNNLDSVLLSETASKDLKNLITDTLNITGRPHRTYKIEPVRTNNGVRLERRIIEHNKP